jgi:DNA modification methylase
MNRANALDGKSWCRNSISVWSDLRFLPEERQIEHPAKFPLSLVRRVIDCFLPPPSPGGSRLVLDPFAGSGTTLIAARAAGCRGLGFELAPTYYTGCCKRIEENNSTNHESCRVVLGDAAHLAAFLPAGSVDLVVTSPPYWGVLARRRTADGKAVRDYRRREAADPAGNPETDLAADLSLAANYEQFLEELANVFLNVLPGLRVGAYCIINLQDLRIGPRFFPLHSDLAGRLTGPGGYLYDDLIIWDRRADYNYLRPLGYPSTFRINKTHEFLIVLRRLN